MRVAVLWAALLCAVLAASAQADPYVELLPYPSEPLQVAVGLSHACALNSLGLLRCWGDGANGKLGYGNEDAVLADNAKTTAMVNVGMAVHSVALGAEHTCALTIEGVVTCWGSNAVGQLGYGHASTGELEPRALADDKYVRIGWEHTVQVCAGSSHTCALSSEGDVKCWGDQTAGALGPEAGENIGDNEAPDLIGRVPLAEAARQISCGAEHTCALLASDGVVCWGKNDDGQLGHSSGALEEVDVSGGVKPVAEVSAGSRSTCVRFDAPYERQVVCWGFGGDGTGYGTTIASIGLVDSPYDYLQKNTLVPIEPLTPAVAVEAVAVGVFPCMLTSSGTDNMNCWGTLMEGVGGANAEFFKQQSPSAPDVINSAHIRSIAMGLAQDVCLVVDGADGAARVHCWGASGGIGSLPNTANTVTLCDNDATTCCGATCQAGGTPPLFGDMCVACDCPAGRSGNDCRLQNCTGGCGEFGRCSLALGACVCDRAYYGTNCELMCANGCSGHGTCGPLGTCVCDDGWGRFDCGASLRTVEWRYPTSGKFSSANAWAPARVPRESDTVLLQEVPVNTGYVVDIDHDYLTRKVVMSKGATLRVSRSRFTTYKTVEDCPEGCNGNGVCDKATLTCACNVGTLGDACQLTHLNIVHPGDTNALVGGGLVFVVRDPYNGGATNATVPVDVTVNNEAGSGDVFVGTVECELYDHEQGLYIGFIMSHYADTDVPADITGEHSLIPLRAGWTVTAAYANAVSRDAVFGTETTIPLTEASVSMAGGDATFDLLGSVDETAAFVPGSALHIELNAPAHSFLDDEVNYVVVTVASTDTGDYVRVGLEETGQNTGVFTASVPTYLLDNAGQPNTPDDTLLAVGESGDTITVELSAIETADTQTGSIGAAQPADVPASHNWCGASLNCITAANGRLAPGNTLLVQLSAMDLRFSHEVPDTVLVLVSNENQNTHVTVALTETSKGSAVFHGQLPTVSGTQSTSEALAVQPGDVMSYKAGALAKYAVSASITGNNAVITESGLGAGVTFNIVVADEDENKLPTQRETVTVVVEGEDTERLQAVETSEDSGEFEVWVETISLLSTPMDANDGIVIIPADRTLSVSVFDASQGTDVIKTVVLPTLDPNDLTIESSQAPGADISVALANPPAGAPSAHVVVRNMDTDEVEMLQLVEDNGSLVGVMPTTTVLDGNTNNDGALLVENLQVVRVFSDDTTASKGALFGILQVDQEATAAQWRRVGDTFLLTFDAGVGLSGTCEVNKNDINAPVGVGAHPTEYEVEYIVQEGDDDWATDKLPIDCSLSDAQNNIVTFDGVAFGTQGDSNPPGFYSIIFSLASANKYAAINSVIDVIITSDAPGYQMAADCRVNGQLVNGADWSDNGDNTYTIKYTVDANVPEQPVGVDCGLVDQATNVRPVVATASLDAIEVDSTVANVTAALISHKDANGIDVTGDNAAVGDMLTIGLTTSDPTLVIAPAGCRVNNVDVGSTYTADAQLPGFVITYTVSNDDANWAPGSLQLVCQLKDEGGNEVAVLSVTGVETLQGDASLPLILAQTVAPVRGVLAAGDEVLISVVASEEGLSVDGDCRVNGVLMETVESSGSTQVIRYVVGVDDNTFPVGEMSIECDFVDPFGNPQQFASVFFDGTTDNRLLYFKLNEENDPVLPGINPKFGKRAGNVEVTIHGGGFVGASPACLFAGLAPVPATVVSETELRCTAPPRGNAEAVVSLEFTMDLSEAQPDYSHFGRRFFFYSINGVIEPNTGPQDGGTTLTVHGEGFPFNPNTEVQEQVDCAFGVVGNVVVLERVGEILSTSTVGCPTPDVNELTPQEISQLIGRDVFINVRVGGSGDYTDFASEDSSEAKRDFARRVAEIESAANMALPMEVRDSHGALVDYHPMHPVRRHQRSVQALRLGVFRFYRSPKIERLWPRYGPASAATQVAVTLDDAFVENDSDVVDVQRYRIVDFLEDPIEVTDSDGNTVLSSNLDVEAIETLRSNPYGFDMPGPGLVESQLQVTGTQNDPQYITVRTPRIAAVTVQVGANGVDFSDDPADPSVNQFNYFVPNYFVVEESGVRVERKQISGSPAPNTWLTIKGVGFPENNGGETHTVTCAVGSSQEIADGQADYFGFREGLNPDRPGGGHEVIDSETVRCTVGGLSARLYNLEISIDGGPFTSVGDMLIEFSAQRLKISDVDPRRAPNTGGTMAEVTMGTTGDESAIPDFAEGVYTCQWRFGTEPSVLVDALDSGDFNRILCPVPTTFAGVNEEVFLSVGVSGQSPTDEVGFLLYDPVMVGDLFDTSTGAILELGPDGVPQIPSAAGILMNITVADGMFLPDGQSQNVLCTLMGKNEPSPIRVPGVFAQSCTPPVVEGGQPVCKDIITPGYVLCEPPVRAAGEYTLCVTQNGQTDQLSHTPAGLLQLASVNGTGVPIAADDYGTFMDLRNDLCDDGVGGVAMCACTLLRYLPCRAGYFAEETGDVCQACSSGTFSPTDGSTECTACPFGTYQANREATECNVCPAFTETVSEGSKVRTDCLCIGAREADQEAGLEATRGYFSVTTETRINEETGEPEEVGVAGEECIECPAGSICRGGTSLPVAEAGFWKSGETINDERGNEVPVFLSCGSELACEANGQCREGHGGRLCAECDDQWYKLGQLCEPCPENAHVRLILFACGVLAVVPLLLFMAHSATKYFTAVGIGINYWQVLALFSDFHLNWPSSVDSAFKLISITNFNVDLFASECSLPISYQAKWVATLALPVCIVVMFVFIYVCLSVHAHFTEKYGETIMMRYPHLFPPGTVPSFHKKMPANARKNRGTLKQRAMKLLLGSAVRFHVLRRMMTNGFFMFLAVAYIFLVAKSVELFDCTEQKDGTFSLDADPTLLCFEPWWFQMLPIGVIATSLYGFGIPILFFYIMHKSRKELDEYITMRMYGSLLERYKKDHHKWELVIMWRKVTIVLAKLFFTNHVLYGATTALVVLFIALLLQLNNKPYRVIYYNRLEFTVILSSCAVLFCGILFFADKFPNENAKHVVTVLVLLLLVVTSVIIVLSVLFMVGRRYLDRSMTREGEGKKIFDRYGKILEETRVLLIRRWWEHANNEQRRVFFTVLDSLMLYREKHKYETKKMRVGVPSFVLAGFDTFCAGVLKNTALPLVHEWIKSCSEENRHRWRYLFTTFGKLEAANAGQENVFALKFSSQSVRQDEAAWVEKYISDVVTYNAQWVVDTYSEDTVDDHIIAFMDQRLQHAAHTSPGAHEALFRSMSAFFAINNPDEMEDYELVALPDANDFGGVDEMDLALPTDFDSTQYGASFAEGMVELVNPVPAWGEVVLPNLSVGRSEMMLRGQGMGMGMSTHDVDIGGLDADRLSVNPVTGETHTSKRQLQRAPALHSSPSIAALQQMRKGKRKDGSSSSSSGASRTSSSVRDDDMRERKAGITGHRLLPSGRQAALQQEMLREEMEEDDLGMPVSSDDVVPVLSGDSDAPVPEMRSMMMTMPGGGGGGAGGLPVLGHAYDSSVPSSLSGLSGQSGLVVPRDTTSSGLSGGGSVLDVGSSSASDAGPAAGAFDVVVMDGLSDGGSGSASSGVVVPAGVGSSGVSSLGGVSGLTTDTSSVSVGGSAGDASTSGVGTSLDGSLAVPTSSSSGGGGVSGVSSSLSGGNTTGAALGGGGMVSGLGVTASGSASSVGVSGISSGSGSSSSGPLDVGSSSSMSMSSGSRGPAQTAPPAAHVMPPATGAAAAASASSMSDAQSSLALSGLDTSSGASAAAAASSVSSSSLAGGSGVLSGVESSSGVSQVSGISFSSVSDSSDEE